MKKQWQRARSERGVALILALIMVLVLSVLVAGLVFITQTQTWTGYNYKTTTQARYSAEAGVQRTMNWLMSANYTAPTVFTPYDMTKYPVMDKGATPQPIVLSAYYGTSANYPTSAVQTAFNTALNDQSVPGVPNATYSTYATLLKMTPGTGVSWLGGGGGGSPQTWQITSIGSVAGVRAAKVQIQATYERGSTPLFTYALAATGTGCKTIDWSSSGYTNSYNSNNGAYGGANVQATSGGDVATNGNMSLSGSAQINGIFSGLNTSVGACPDGITSSSSASPIDRGTNQLTAPLSYPLPWGCTALPCYPTPTPPTTNQNMSGNCGTVSGCSVVAGNLVLSPSTQYGNLNLSGGTVVHLTAGTYNVNSVNLSGGSQMVVDSGPVILNIAGNGASNAFNLSGGSLSNGTGVPSNLQIVYPGTDPMTLSGGSGNAAVVYAPNSAITMSGSSPWFGAIIGKTYTSSGGSTIHFDLALLNSLLQVGPYQPVSYTWNKF